MNIDVISRNDEKRVFDVLFIMCVYLLNDELCIY